MQRFTWWDLHESSWRRARLLFVLAGVVVAIYAAGILAVVGVSLVGILTGSLDDLERWIDDIGTFELVIAVLLLLGVVAMAILAIGWRGLSRATMRMSHARRPTLEEARAVRQTVASFALAYGMPAPQGWVVDDPAPNALAFGRPAAGHVCVTTGALGLARDELGALCMFEVTALASRAYAYATSAADLVVLGEWCTRLLWSAAAIVALSSLVGVPLEIAATYFVSTVVLVAVTRPVLVVADRGLVSLIDETSELIDLETIRYSAQPESLALLLLDVVEDRHQTRSRPEIAHLWFERDLVRRDDQRGLARLVGDSALSDLGVPAFGARAAGSTRRGLLDRAAAAVDFADGDAALRGRLVRAGTARNTG